MTPFRLKNCDAVDLLEELDDQSIDLIVSSPPYFMGKEYDTSTRLEDFVDAHKRIFPHLCRVLKPGGSLCWQVGIHAVNSEIVPLDALVFAAFRSPEIKLRNRIIWTFGHGPHARKRLSGRHETILWYTKGNDYYFDLNAVRVPQKYPGKKHYKGVRKGEYSGNPLGKNPGDVWEIPNVKAGHVEKTAHPCQFPVALVQRLVRALCPTDGVLLDPFAGAASAGVAATVEGRRFVGAELNASYWAIGEERLKQSSCGDVRYRPLDVPLFEPVESQSVSKTPSFFKHAAKELAK